MLYLKAYEDTMLKILAVYTEMTCFKEGEGDFEDEAHDGEVFTSI